MNTNTLIDRVAVVAELARLHPQMGRTALMKYCYLLQEVRNVPLGYNFELYTYGPYDSAVLDINTIAQNWRVIAETVEEFPTGTRKTLSEGEAAGELRNAASAFLDAHKSDIEWVVSKFSDYTSAGMELIGTFVWVDREAKKHSRQETKRTIISKVLQIKPQFTEEQANKVFDYLKGLQVLTWVADE